LAAELRQSFPLPAVWGEAVLDDWAVVLVSSEEASAGSAVSPLLFSRHGSTWKLVLASFGGMRADNSGVPEPQRTAIETLEVWAKREVEQIAKPDPPRRPDPGPKPKE
jgi:hypothetical protein